MYGSSRIPALNSCLPFNNFLCFDEQIHIKGKDFTLNNEKFVSIYIPRSKTDQVQQGNEVLVSRTGSKLCPVAMLEKYVRQGDVEFSDDRFIFYFIVKIKEERLSL